MKLPIPAMLATGWAPNEVRADAIKYIMQGEGDYFHYLEQAWKIMGSG